MSSFKHSFLHHNTNEDFASTIKSIIAVVNECDIKDESFKPIRKRLYDLEDYLNGIIRKMHTGHFTNEIQKLVKERQELMRSMQIMLKGLSGRTDKEILKRVNVLDFWLKQFRKSFYHPLIVEHSAAVYDLNSVRKEKPEVDEALRYLNFHEEFEEAITLTNKIMQMTNERSGFVAKNKKHTLKWRNKVLDDLKDLFSYLEIASKYSEDEESVYSVCARTVRYVLKRNERIYNIKIGMLRGKKKRQEGKDE